MLSILASYWRASNWVPSGADPAILFFQLLHNTYQSPVSQ
jgi:hypothetical protein